jgi:hypothetical protein
VGGTGQPWGRCAGSPPGNFVGESADPCPYLTELKQQELLRDTGTWFSSMKMLLASNDVLVLQTVAKRLVASGVPIALCRPSETASYLELWIQRDSESCPARKLLPARVVPAAATPAPVNPLCSGSRGRGRAGRRGILIVTSRIGFCIWWRRQLPQT